RAGVGETAETAVIGWDDADSLQLGVYSSPTDTTISPFVTVTSGGLVGIGTSSPSGTLDVWSTRGRYASFAANGRNTFSANDNTLTPVLTLQNTMETAGHGASLVFNLGYGGTGNIQGTAVTSGRIYTVAENTYTSTASTQDASLVFDTALNGALAEEMRITSAGLVGIGTSTPNRALSVASSGNLIFGIERTASQINQYSFEITSAYGGDSGSFNLIATYAAGDIALRGSTSGNAQMILKGATGFVGIGDTAPNQLLGLLGTNAQTSIEESDTEFLRTGVGETAGTSIIGWDDADSFQLGVYSSPTDTTISPFVTVTSAGLVGIGTTTPGSLFDVHSASAPIQRLTFSNTGSFGRFAIYENENPVGQIQAIGSGFATTERQLDLELFADADISLWAGNSETVTFKSGGNVGIGSTTPNSPLVIGTGNLRMSIDAGEGIFFDAGTSAGIGSLVRNSTIGGANDMVLTARSGIGFTGSITSYDQAISSYQMYLTSGGLLGIGTTAPSRALDVWGSSAGTTVTTDANPSVVVTNSNTTNNNYASYVFSSINASNVQFSGAKLSAIFTDHTASSEDADIAFTTKAAGTMAERMRIVSTGNVGIGDSTPTEGTLVVGSAGGGNIYATFATAGTDTLCWDGAGASLITDCSSLAEYKDNVVNLSFGLEAIRQLTPREFDWNISHQRHDLGFVAEEVAAVNPLLATWNEEGELRGVKYEKMAALLTKGIQELDLRTRFASSSATGVSLTVASSTGNISIGTTTNALYKLAVGGDIAATGYVNLSTETSKTNISYLSASTTDEILSEIESVKIATYRYKSESSRNPLRLGLIAEEAPREVLSVDGKGVDIYKLATYSLAGVQALSDRVAMTNARVDSLEERIKRLEDGSITVASGSPLTFSTSTLVAALESLGVSIRDGVLAVGTLVSDRFVVAADDEGSAAAGSAVILEGSLAVEIENNRVASTSRVFITMTSPLYGGWYVTDKGEGSFTVALEEEQDDDVTFDYFIVETEGQIEEQEGTQILSEPEEDEETDEPVITDAPEETPPATEPPPTDETSETPPSDAGEGEEGAETGADEGGSDTGSDTGGEATGGESAGGEGSESGSEGGGEPGGESSGSESGGGESSGGDTGSSGGSEGGGDGSAGA
ncbi:MAG: tail fiber domain-containing protein, partial [Candidatus Pacebacteria bacterium]|nr:tail fiber domain-containing protein [Candidatus Paceibacterota bacterium]